MVRTSRRTALIAAAALALALVAIGLLVWRSTRGTIPIGPVVVPPLPAGSPTVIVAAGDIAECGEDLDERTADVVDRIDGTVVVLGDNAYPSGTAGQFERCYDASWGRFKDRTRPVPGNHEYDTDGAAGYLAYFGDAATPDGTTWYAWDAGPWRVLALDSDCDDVGGCDEASPQGRWLAAELAATDARCSIAVFHHPRWSSGEHGPSTAVDPLWRQLHGGGVEVVLNGHDHDYERFAPQDPDGRRDDANGIRQFVVGTGGGALRDVRAAQPNSELREDDTYGVLRLALDADGYTWDFVPIGGQTFTDHGTGTCH
jgi:acid phosphatase type 7